MMITRTPTSARIAGGREFSGPIGIKLTHTIRIKLAIKAPALRNAV